MSATQPHMMSVSTPVMMPAIRFADSSPQVAALPSARTGLYVFCYTRPDASPAICGSGWRTDQPLRPFTHLGITAVVCSVEIAEPNSTLTQSGRHNLMWIGPRACRHEEIVQDVMLHAPVFPLPFGTLFRSEESLRRSIEQHKARIDSFLQFSSDKEEWTLNGVMSRQRYEQAMLGYDSGGLRPGATSGLDYMMEQKQRTERLQQARSSIQGAEINLLEHLRPVTLMRRRRHILTMTNDAPTRLVFHWAILVHRSSRDQMLRFSRQSEGKWSENGLRLEVRGPAPSFSFCPTLDALLD